MNTVIAHGWHGDGAGPLGWAVFALLMAALVLGAVALAGWLGGWRERRAIQAPPTGATAADPLAILRLRYARGELAREEFLRASEDLGGTPAGGEAAAGEAAPDDTTPSPPASS
jgi:uncharacterized membrane protein